MRILAALLFVSLLLGCGGDQPPPPETARTVIVMPLTETTPEPPFEVTGVAEPYREADVSFEVSGRVTFILDVGRNVDVQTRPKTETELATARENAVKNARGEIIERIDPLVHTGDVIAQVDPTSYKQRLDAAQMRLKTAEASLKATIIDAEQLAPAAVKRARAQRDAALSDVEATRAMIASYQSTKDRSERELERYTELRRTKQVSQSELDQYQNQFDTALANLAQSKAALQTAVQQANSLEAALTEAEASVLVKNENVGRGRAELAELKVAVEQAQTDLDRCTLRAPFIGRITNVMASNGDYVQAGSPVMRITLIDPIKVACTVSADRERDIEPGNYAAVMPERLKDFGSDEPLIGTVFEKGAVADPTTRTFRIEVMVRNARRLLAKPSPDAVVINFRALLPAVVRHFGEGGDLYVCETCDHVKDGRHYVYRVKGIKWGVPRPENLFDRKLELERLEIKWAGNEPRDYMTILNWPFRRVTGKAGLTNGDLLISFEEVRPEDLASGVIIDQYDWAIRPGDIVPVAFEGKQMAKGFWVPDDAIRALNEKRAVYAVEDGKAREIPVTVYESLGRLRRIGGEGLTAGMKLVVRGVHYVFEGAKTFVSSEIELATILRKAQ